MSATILRMAPPLTMVAEDQLFIAAALFDPDWYRAEYPDVAVSGTDPVDHYLRHGAAEGRNPNGIFNTRWYAMRYPDVHASGMNPFLHFVLYGCREGRAAREVGGT